MGLTATPKDYLKNVDPQKLSQKDPRAWEKRQLLDTYTTFGCKTASQLINLGLLDGVRGGFLVNPIVSDARTDITAELLSEKGYAVMVENEEGVESEETFFHKDFEKKFFPEKDKSCLLPDIFGKCFKRSDKWRGWQKYYILYKPKTRFKNHANAQPNGEPALARQIQF